MSTTKHTPMVIAAAREMVRIHAEACNVNKDDLWAIESSSFLDEAQSVIDASGASAVVEALEWMLDAFGDRNNPPKVMLAMAAVHKARAAIAKATGSAA